MKTIIVVILAALVPVCTVAYVLNRNGCEQASSENNILSPPCTGLIKARQPTWGPTPPSVGEQIDLVDTQTVYRRVTSNQLLGTEEGSARHNYSRRQVWNSDESIMYFAGTLIDAESVEVINNSLGLSSEVVWSTAEPNRLYAVRYNEAAVPGLNEFGYLNVETGEFVSVAAFKSFKQCSIGNGKGVLSNDNRFVVLVCKNRDDSLGRMYSLDAHTGEILGEKIVEKEYKWAGFSASGKYILEQKSSENNRSRELIRYNPDFSAPSTLTRFVEHGDLGVDMNGDDVFVMIGWDYVYYVRIKDALKVRIDITGKASIVFSKLFDSQVLGHGHVSCRNTSRPGWCYISSNGKRVVASIGIGVGVSDRTAKLKNGETYRVGFSALEHWGFHNSSGASYEAQAKVSVSPSGKKIIVTSDWNGEHEVNDYVIEMGSSSR